MVGLSGCEKVPLTEVHAAFTLADGNYFAGESTLFVFYRVEADQGIGPESQMELSYVTDTEAFGWTAMEKLAMVHTHVPVDCGPNARCGSASVKVVLPPRNVRVRLRYHRDGEMALETLVATGYIDDGPAPAHRSLLVYGVMDASNTWVEWRARHQQGSLRNEQVQELGLRRFFRIDARVHGDVGPQDATNPYGYAFAATCPDGLSPLSGAPLSTTDRAAFDVIPLPPWVANSPVVCARSFVTDANAGFEAPALARKNPEVRPAFPALKSPIRSDTPVGFVLRPCNRTISDPHLAMQEQRLLVSGAPEICIDDWRAPDFAGRLATSFRTRIDAVRAAGADMVLSLVLHHDDNTGALASVVEDALAQVLIPERDASSPRVSGAFLFDSIGHAIARPELKPLVLWCPADLGRDLAQIPSTALRSCPLLPDTPDIQLGPLRFNNLPILPTRDQYLTFIGKYGEAQAGQMTSLSFLAPERTPVSQNVTFGDYGVATFFNNEIITAAPTDAFSYCTPTDGSANLVVFRTALAPDVMPLAVLPQVQEQFPQSTYALGLLWEFPFLLRLQYQVFLAGQLSVLSLSVAFGIKSEQDKYYGATQWEQGQFALDTVLLQCTRFCDAPTFDSAGVYNVATSFRRDFANQCYAPTFPVPGEGGFPRDP